MEIKLEKGQDKGFLPDGRHTVKITHIEEGVSEHQEVPFFAVRFENEQGFVNQRFYTSPQALPIALSLFSAVGITADGAKSLNTKELLGKEVSIEVGEHHYESPSTGNERTLKQAGGFQAA